MKEKNYSVMYPESSEFLLELSDSVLSLEVGLETEVEAEGGAETELKRLLSMELLKLHVKGVDVVEVQVETRMLEALHRLEKLLEGKSLLGSEILKAVTVLKEVTVEVIHRRSPGG